MSDYIEREAAIKAMLTRYWDGKETLREIMNSIPAANVVPVIHARWVGVSPMVDTSQCSNCGFNVLSAELETPYCPWCGARMDA